MAVNNIPNTPPIASPGKLLSLESIGSFITNLVNSIGNGFTTSNIAINGLIADDNTNIAAIAANTTNIATNTASITALKPGVAKAWVSFTGSTGAIRASFNVASISRAAAGIYDITFITPFSSANFVCVMNPNSTSVVVIGQSQGKTAATVRVVVFNTTPALVDPDSVEVVCFGV